MIAENTEPVTLANKCYVYVCAGCDLLEVSTRSDALTCSGACRVRVHRNGYLQSLRKLAGDMKISAAIILQTAAVERLRPDLYAEMARGAVRIEDTRADVYRAFMEAVFKAVEMSREAAS